MLQRWNVDDSAIVCHNDGMYMTQWQPVCHKDGMWMTQWQPMCHEEEMWMTQQLYATKMECG